MKLDTLSCLLYYAKAEAKADLGTHDGAGSSMLPYVAHTPHTRIHSSH